MMDVLVEFIRTMPFWYWWVLAIGLLVIELGTGSTYFLWPATAAVITGFFDIWPLDEAWRLQLAVFATITVILAIVAPPYVKPWLHKSQADHHLLNERGEQKIGRRVRVEIAFNQGTGKVRIGDTLWLAESESGEDFTEGMELEITRAEGTKLFVKSTEEA